MIPTEEEKVRIQEAQLANPDVPLGSAEQFLLGIHLHTPNIYKEYKYPKTICSDLIDRDLM